MNVQKKNLIRNIRFVADQLEAYPDYGERVYADSFDAISGRPCMATVTVVIGNHHKLEIVYPNQEDK